MHHFISGKLEKYLYRVEPNRRPNKKRSAGFPSPCRLLMLFLKIRTGDIRSNLLLEIGIIFLIIPITMIHYVTLSIFFLYFFFNFLMVSRMHHRRIYDSTHRLASDLIDLKGEYRHESYHSTLVHHIEYFFYCRHLAAVRCLELLLQVYCKDEIVAPWRITAASRQEN